MRLVRTTIVLIAIGLGAAIIATPAKAEYLSAHDARYYARDAVRTAIPNAIRVRASCGARISSSLFSCRVKWRKPYGPLRTGRVRVRALDDERIRSVFVRSY